MSRPRDAEPGARAAAADEADPERGATQGARAPERRTDESPAPVAGDSSPVVREGTLQVPARGHRIRHGISVPS
jgi:hypothetical protein